MYSYLCLHDDAELGDFKRSKYLTSIPRVCAKYEHLSIVRLICSNGDLYRIVNLNYYTHQTV